MRIHFDEERDAALELRVNTTAASVQDPEGAIDAQQGLQLLPTVLLKAIATQAQLLQRCIFVEGLCQELCPVLRDAVVTEVKAVQHRALAQVVSDVLNPIACDAAPTEVQRGDVDVAPERACQHRTGAVVKGRTLGPGSVLHRRAQVEAPQRRSVGADERDCPLERKRVPVHEHRRFQRLKRRQRHFVGAAAVQFRQDIIGVKGGDQSIDADIRDRLVLVQI
mmetsp:Transcript_5379/g.9717  ORF Transcript_5379/g.9717 Transcript_5379/m.9717 type:complete len:222 (-) Transcript_5379:1327-1992(-)